VQQLATVPDTPPDGRVLELLQAGDAARAFDCVLQHFEGKVYRLCRAILRNPAESEDTAQESLIRIWKALPRFDGRAALSTWIYAITRNRCLTAIERRRELHSLSDTAIELEADAASAVVEKDPDDPLALLRELAEGLPERYRRVLILFYYEDRSVAEVASQLGIPEGTVKTNLFRARALLLEQLERHGLNDRALWLETGT
jgi:RNA polymerase sigma-70 factor (ECF subfamily)